MPFSEGAMIEFLRTRARRGANVVVGIGHDAAVIASPSGDQIVLKSDQSIEGVHFTRGEATVDLFGRKALARVLSDLSAIGARPIACLCSAALPGDLGQADAQRLFEGLLELADQSLVSLVGGDLSRSPNGICLDVAAIGYLEGRRPMLRSGAAAGDALVVSGPLGGSRAGHHLRFEPRWREGIALAQSQLVHACIDLSDGLARDLHHIVEASRTGARIDVESLPRRVLPNGTCATVEQALHDGEDYELLFATPPAAIARLAALPELAGIELVRIGSITPCGEGVNLAYPRGALVELPRGGFEHQFGAS